MTAWEPQGGEGVGQAAEVRLSRVEEVQDLEVEFGQPGRKGQAQGGLQGLRHVRFRHAGAFRRAQQGRGVVVVIVHQVKGQRQEALEGLCGEHLPQEGTLQLPDLPVIQVAFGDHLPLL